VRDVLLVRNVWKVFRSVLMCEERFDGCAKLVVVAARLGKEHRTFRDVLR